MSATLSQLIANACKTAAVSVALFSSAATKTSPGTELSGTGYSRQAPTWGTPTAAAPSVLTGTANMTIPAGGSVVAFGLYDSSGNYLTGGSCTTASSGASAPYALTITLSSDA